MSETTCVMDEGPVQFESRPIPLMTIDMSADIQDYLDGYEAPSGGIFLGAVFYNGNSGALLRLEEGEYRMILRVPRYPLGCPEKDIIYEIVLNKDEVEGLLYKG